LKKKEIIIMRNKVRINKINDANITCDFILSLAIKVLIALCELNVNKFKSLFTFSFNNTNTP
jgi:hypothetical protein